MVDIPILECFINSWLGSATLQKLHVEFFIRRCMVRVVYLSTSSWFAKHCIYPGFRFPSVHHVQMTCVEVSWQWKILLEGKSSFLTYVWYFLQLTSTAIGASTKRRHSTSLVKQNPRHCKHLSCTKIIALEQQEFPHGSLLQEWYLSNGCPPS